MHEIVATEVASELPCHRMATADTADATEHADEIVIRASCGRDVVGHVVGDVKLRRPVPELRFSGTLQLLPAIGETRPFASSADVPTGPPRAPYRS